MKWDVIMVATAAVREVVVVPVLLAVLVVALAVVMVLAKVVAWVIVKVTAAAPVVIINFLMEGFGPPILIIRLWKK